MQTNPFEFKMFFPLTSNLLIIIHFIIRNKMIFLLVSILLITIHCMISTPLIKRKKRGLTAQVLLPPGPPSLPFIGNLHQFDKANPHIYLWKLSKKYGPLAYLRHGHTPILVVSSAAMAKEVLKTQDLSFCSRPHVLGQQKLSYGGIDMAFSPYNDYWKQMRRVSMLHLFSQKQVMSFEPIRGDEVSRMISKISNLSSPANLSEIAMSMASNLICRVAFGRRYDDNEFEKIRFDRLVIEAQALMVSFYFSDHFPGLGWVDKVSGKLGRLEKNYKELGLFYQQLIDEHLSQSRLKPDGDGDILNIMLHLKKQTSFPIDLTWDHIKALLMNLVVAGTDTVAAMVVWSMTALMKKPQIMKKVQKEIRETIGGKGKVYEDDIHKLPYLRAVVLEVLRLYPPAPLLYRSQILEDECIVKGYRIKPKTSVVINIWAIARDPEIWKNPYEFLPERFISYDDHQVLFNIFKAGGAGEFEMIPFGGGRRGCPGMRMGLISAELALANLLYSFDWELPDGMNIHDIDTDAIPGLTMHKKNALVLVPNKYNFQHDDPSG